MEEIEETRNRLVDVESGLKSMEHKVEGMSALQNSTEEGLAAMQAMAEKVAAQTAENPSKNRYYMHKQLCGMRW